MARIYSLENKALADYRGEIVLFHANVFYTEPSEIFLAVDDDSTERKALHRLIGVSLDDIEKVDAGEALTLYSPDFETSYSYYKSKDAACGDDVYHFYQFAEFILTRVD